MNSKDLIYSVQEEEFRTHGCITAFNDLLSLNNDLLPYRNGLLQNMSSVSLRVSDVPL